MRLKVIALFVEVLLRPYLKRYLRFYRLGKNILKTTGKMYRLNYLLFQGLLLLISIENLALLQNGEKYQVDASRMTGKFACQDDVMNIRCWWPQVITIYRATYSRTQSSICSQNKVGLNSSGHCDPKVKTSMASSLCDGQIKCNITVDSSTMGDHCPDVFKYLSVVYTCKTPIPTTQPPYVQNKTTMVLTKPSTPVQSLNPRRTGRPTKRTLFSQSADDDEYHSIIDAGFSQTDRACFYTNSGFFVVMSILAVLFQAMI